MPVTVYPPLTVSAGDNPPVTVNVGQSWRLGQGGSLQVLDQTLFMVAEWAANQWGYVEIGTPA
jgi:hypothetical protein